MTERGAEPLLGRLAEEAADRRGRRTAVEQRAWVGALVEEAGRDAQARPTPRRLLRRWEVAAGEDATVPHTRELHEVTVLAGMPVRVRVLVPAEPGPHPVVLAVPGHGPGAVAVCGPDPGSGGVTGSNGHHWFGLGLVRHGAVVVVPEVLGIGPRQSAQDRAYDPAAPHGCYRLATRLLEHGLTLAGVRVTELRGLLDVLPDLVPGLLGDRVGAPVRVGAAGFSGGALLACLLGAVDDRVAALALTGWPGTHAGSTHRVRHCLCNHLPGQAGVLDQPDLLALLAPRPLAVATGRRDRIFAVEGFEEAVRRLTATYAAAGAPDHLLQHVHPGGHEVDGSRLWPWLVRALGRPGDPVRPVSRP